MNGLLTVIAALIGFFAYASPVFAASPNITNYTSDTLNMITLIATASAVFFLVKGGYLYITSTGNVQNLQQAKKTIRNAIIGLIIVLAASTITSILSDSLNSPSNGTSSEAISIAPITEQKPSDGLTQVLIDAVSGFMQNIVQSATQPIVNGIIGYLTTTPDLLSNQVIVKFWLVILGITDSLYVLVVALLGLHFMSASTFGFEEVELRQLLPRIGLSFLGANSSLFLANYAVITSNALVSEVLNSTGSINQAWINNAINLQSLMTGSTPIITLVFLIIFLIISIVLLLMYISRLIMVSLGAVLSPLVFLLWAIPKFSDFAEVAVKTYIATVFIIFVHVVIIQLASSFLSLPENSKGSLVSIAAAIGLFLTLLKTPSMMMQMVMYTSRNGTFRKLGGQIMNIMTTDNSSTATRSLAVSEAKLPRKAVKA